VWRIQNFKTRDKQRVGPVKKTRSSVTGLVDTILVASVEFVVPKGEIGLAKKVRTSTAGEAGT